jgi:hypothetical protein
MSSNFGGQFQGILGAGYLDHQMCLEELREVLWESELTD